MNETETASTDTAARTEVEVVAPTPRSALACLT